MFSKTERSRRRRKRHAECRHAVGAIVLLVGTGLSTAGNATVIYTDTVSIIEPTTPDDLVLIGFGAQSTVNVQPGGSLQVTSSPTAGPGLHIGTNANGASGNGTLAISGIGASVNVSGGSSAATVTVGTTDTNRGNGTGIGTLNLIDGGELRIDGGAAAGQMLVGNGLGASAEVLVSGSGSALTVTGSAAKLAIGNLIQNTGGGAGFGELTVENGGVVQVLAADGSAEVVVGSGSGTGHLNVNDGGRLDVQGDLRISSDFAGNNSQTGVALINGSGIASVTGTVYVGNGSTSGDINGILGGTGVVNGNVVVQGGGLYAPGNSPGLSTVNGDVLFDAGWLELEIAGLTAGLYDVLNVTGTVDLTNANLLFSFLDGYLPSTGDVFGFLNASEIMGLSTANVVYRGAPAGFHFDLSERNGSLHVTAVPEPSTVGLMVGGLLTVMLLRRRARRS